MTLRTLIVASLLSLWAGISAVAAPVVILTGEVGGQGPGSVVDDTEVVALRSGEMLVFNDATGQTRTLTGPYEGPLSGEPGGEAPKSALERLVSARAAEQSRLGAIRAAPGQTPVTLEVISIAQSSVQCFDGEAALLLWRPETLDVDSRLKLRDKATGAETTTFWQEGDMTIAWPSELPLRSGASYLLSLDAAPRAIELTLHDVSMRSSAETTASKLIEVGCRRQALTLLERIVN